MEMNKLEEHAKTWQKLTGSHLKIIAIITMTIDHIALFLLPNAEWANIGLFTFGKHEINTFIILRCIGRMAFPIFAFLIVEGFNHTHNRMKYGINLLTFAILSEIPWNLVRSGSLFYPTQNVFFTLFLGYLGLCAIDYFKTEKIKLCAMLVFLLSLSVFLKSDFGCSGYGFIIMLYALQSNSVIMATIGSCMLSSRWIAGIAFIPILMYNGKRGFIKGNILKFAFYIFYPAHLLIIYFIKQYAM